MRVNIHTNTQKSQFRQVKDGVWQILGIPITVDNAVMNGVLYEASENAKGNASYRGQPVTLKHPLDCNGNSTSALSGDGLMNNFSGGVVINTYNHNGINYADAEFKEKMMLAQDNGDYYVSKLKNGESIGISTGLYFDGNNECGVADNGKKYIAKAINQIGDHVAMLPDNEPPAGGEATFIKFNGENDDQTIAIDIDAMINAIGDIDAVICEMATNDAEKGLLERFFATCKQVFAHNKKPCDNSNHDKNILINNKEGDAMRETMIAALAAKGITVNAEMSDADLLAKYNDLNKVEVPDVAAAINAAIAPLTEKLAAVEAGLTANADKELDALAKQAAPFMGLEVAEAKTMGVNALHKVLAKNGVVIGAPMATNAQSPKDKSGSEIALEPWNEKGAK